MLSNRIGIVVPTFNRLDNLRRVLWSLESQTSQNFHCTIADDGSDDGTSEYVRSLSKGHWGQRLSIVESGSFFIERRSQARNEGVRALPEDIDIVMFLDSDLLLQEDAIARIGEVASASPRSVIFPTINWLPPMPGDSFEEERLKLPGSVRLLNKYVPMSTPVRIDGTFVGPEIRPSSMFTEGEQRLRGNCALFTCACIHRNHFERAQGFDESMEGYGYEDMDLGIRLEKMGLFQNYLPDVHALHMWHPKPSIARTAIDNQRNLAYIIGKHGWDDWYSGDVDWSHAAHYNSRNGALCMACGGSWIVVNRFMDNAIKVSSVRQLRILGFSSKSDFTPQGFLGDFPALTMHANPIWGY